MSDNKVFNEVYLVTMGSYGDYRILEAFLSKEEAKKFSEEYDSSEIEEYDVDGEASADVYLLWTFRFQLIVSENLSP